MKFFSRLPAAHLRPDELSRLAANDLPERKAQKLRRHLSTCALCQAEWQSVQTVWQVARDEHTHALAVPPDALRERIFAALPNTVLARRERKPAILAFLFARPVAFASLAVAASVVVGVGALTYGPALVFHAPRAVAFEDVETAMNGIKTATWTQTFTVTRKIPSRKYHSRPLLAGVIRRRMESQCFLQANPPRIAIVSRITACPPDEEASLRKVTKSVYDGTFVTYFDEEKQKQSKQPTQILNGDRFQNGEEMVRHALLFPSIGSKEFGLRRNALYDSDRAGNARQNAWISVPDVLNGKPVVRLQKKVSRVSHGLPKRTTKLYTKDTFWVNPKTYRVMRRETEMQVQPNEPDALEIKLTCEAYRYNTELPPDVFDAPKKSSDTP